jgi:hypothetical protein
MADEAGTFRLSKVEAPAEATLFQWVLFNADGDPIAESVRPMGLATAKKSVSGSKPTLPTAIGTTQPAAFLREPFSLNDGRTIATEG